MPDVVDDPTFGPELSLSVPPVGGRGLPLEQLRHEASTGLAAERKKPRLSGSMCYAVDVSSSCTVRVIIIQK